MLVRTEDIPPPRHSCRARMAIRSPSRSAGRGEKEYGAADEAAKVAERGSVSFRRGKLSKCRLSFANLESRTFTVPSGRTLIIGASDRRDPVPSAWPRPAP